jgi:hypothetical protein
MDDSELPAMRRLHRLLLKSGAGEESRTLDLNLGKVALYQLSYSRVDCMNTVSSCSGSDFAPLHSIKKEASQASFLNLEREKSLELSTSTLARLRSTN